MSLIGGKASHQNLRSIVPLPNLFVQSLMAESENEVLRAGDTGDVQPRQLRIRFTGPAPPHGAIQQCLKPRKSFKSFKGKKIADNNNGIRNSSDAKRYDRCAKVSDLSSNSNNRALSSNTVISFEQEVESHFSFISLASMQAHGMPCCYQRKEWIPVISWITDV